MGLLDSAIGVIGASSGSPSPIDDYWYNTVGTMTTAGIRLTPEGAQKVSAFYRGVDLLSTAVAMLPWPVYKRLPNDRGKEVARDHPLYDVLNREANNWLDSFQWKRMMMRHVILRGNGLNLMAAGPRGFVDQMVPFSPDRTRITLKNGRRLFSYQEDNGATTTYTQDEVFYLCGASDDGVTGVGIVQWAKDSLGLAVATESYAARLFSQGSLYGTVLEHPGRLDDEQVMNYRKQFKEATAGLANAHSAVVLQQGMKANRITMTGEETQFIASRKFSIDDIARWLGVPRMMLENSDPSFGNAEQFNQNFVTYSLGPWLSMLESAAQKQLIVEPDLYFTEFKRDALVRGDIAARWQAYHVAVTDGVFTRNEVREIENRNKLDGLDEPLTPAHIVGKQPPQAGAPEPTPADPQPPVPPKPAKAEAIAQASASRLLRKEIAAVQKMAVRHANDQEGFAVAVTDFYAKHAQLVTETLQMPEAQAQEYCASQAGQALGEHWIGALELWNTEHYAAGLAALALEDAA